MIKDAPAHYHRWATEELDDAPTEIKRNLAFVAAYTALVPPPPGKGAGRPPPPQRSEPSQASSSRSSAPPARPSQQTPFYSPQEEYTIGTQSSEGAPEESEEGHIPTEESLEVPHGMEQDSSSACTETEEEHY